MECLVFGGDAYCLGCKRLWRGGEFGFLGVAAW